MYAKKGISIMSGHQQWSQQRKLKKELSSINISVISPTPEKYWKTFQWKSDWTFLNNSGPPTISGSFQWHSHSSINLLVRDYYWQEKSLIKKIYIYSNNNPAIKCYFFWMKVIYIHTYIRTYICTCVVMVIFIGNGHGDMSFT